MSSSISPSDEHSTVRGLWKFKDETFFAIAAVLILIGSLFLLVGVWLFFDPDETDNIGAGLCGVFFSVLFFFLPALLLVKKGKAYKKKQQTLEKLAEYLKVVKHGSTQDIATAIQKSEMEAVLLIKEALEKGLISGYFTEENGQQVFYVTEFSFHPYR